MKWSDLYCGVTCLVKTARDPRTAVVTSWSSFSILTCECKKPVPSDWFTFRGKDHYQRAKSAGEAWFIRGMKPAEDEFSCTKRE